jgi:hypothetical protein
MTRAINILIGSLLLQTIASAQVGYLWSVAELQRASDVVVVATPEVTRETGVRSELTELQPPVPVIEVKTKFRVLSVLKGTISGSTLLLRHFRLDDARIRGGCINCGGFIQFSSDALATKVCRAGDVSPQQSQCDYLLFLRREDTGDFAAASGRVSPGSAVFLLRRAG